MEPVAPSQSSIDVMRAIARAGFAYTAAKSLCDAAGWRLADDEFDLGYVRYDIPVSTADSFKHRQLAVLISENNVTPCACLPLFYFDEDRATRQPFDQAYAFIAKKMAVFLGKEADSGTYSYPHRDNWLFSYAGWSLSDSTFLLVQDEYDIQFGMDVTLWIQPAGTRIEAPVVVQ